METQSSVRGVFLDAPESPIQQQQLHGSGALLSHQGYDTALLFAAAEEIFSICTPAHFPTTSSSQNTKPRLMSRPVAKKGQRGKWL